MSEGVLFTLPDQIFCPEIPTVNVCAALLPGGIPLEDIDLLRQLQPALAPLVPLFNILEVVVQIKVCLTAFVDALGPPPDPTKLFDCIPELERKLAAILRMLPAVSLPQLIVDLVDCVIRQLQKLRGFILRLQAQLLAIAAVLAKAQELDDSHLNLIGVCANDRAAATLDDEMKGLIVIGRLLGFLRLFLDLIGADSSLVPDFSKVSGAPLADAIKPLNDMIEVLTTIRGLIPLPPTDPLLALLPHGGA